MAGVTPRYVPLRGAAGSSGYCSCVVAEIFADLRAMYRAKRDRMLDTLRSAGFKALKPQGSYFIMCDWRGVAPARVIDNIQDKHLGRHLARFPVCKKDETLRAAAEKLSKLGKL